MTGLVSIIIPAYNRANLLPRALDSVKQQIYRPLEIIVVDDGSTDNTADVVGQWKSQNVSDNLRLIYFHKENGGPSSSRNMGLKNASGQYVFFLDSDDCLYKNHVQDGVNVLERDQSDCVIFGFSFTTTGEKRGVYLPPSDLSALESFLMGYTWGYASCFMSRRDLLRQVGFWNEAIRISEDYEFLGRTLIASRKSSTLHDHLLTVWRGQHSSLTLTKDTKAGLRDRLIAEETIVNLLVERRDIPDVLLTQYAGRLFKTAINMYARRETDFAKQLGLLATKVDRGPWSILEKSKRFVWRHGKLLGPLWIALKDLSVSLKKWRKL
jgi:hypothetical protein